VSGDQTKVVQDLYAAFGRGDVTSIVGMMTEDAVWRVAGRGDYPTIGTWRGAKGVADFFKLVAETERPTEFSPQEFFAVKDRVFVLGHYTWTIIKTGKSVTCDFVHIFELRDGKVSGFTEFTDTAQFVEAYRG
jgi:ketosteroid isomerase-like protein